MIPIDNSVAGRVADIHHLMPASNLYIVGEHFLRGASPAAGGAGRDARGLETVRSHVHALGQCRKVIRELGLQADRCRRHGRRGARARGGGDPTPGRHRHDARGRDLWSRDPQGRTSRTRSTTPRASSCCRPKPQDAEPEERPVITSFIFRVRNVPAALYKAMGGFATNGVNMTKLEILSARGPVLGDAVLCRYRGPSAERPVRLALEELEFFTSSLRVLGVYKASPYRAEIAGVARGMGALSQRRLSTRWWAMAMRRGAR